MLAPLDLHHAAILLDVDGTLLDIAPTPDKVHVSASLRHALTKLRERTGGALALVSGRSIDDLDRIFAPLHVTAIGGHGAEMRFFDGRHPEGRESGGRRPAIPDRLRKRIVAGAKAHEGVLVEDKGYALAVHYRLAAKSGPALRKLVDELCAHEPAGALEILPGKAVIEIKAAGFNKGTAVRELMTHPPFHGRRPVFVGDDVTDEAAFAVLPDYEGIALSVGRKMPGAHSRFSTPSDVRRWLERLADDGGSVLP